MPKRLGLLVGLASVGIFLLILAATLPGFLRWIPLCLALLDLGAFFAVFVSARQRRTY